MKVYIILADFRQEYEQPNIVAVYSNLERAESSLKEWEDMNSDNCEEIRYLFIEEVK